MYDVGYEPGYFYSPIPDLNEIRMEADKIFIDKDLQEIDLNTENQIKLLEELKTYYSQYLYNLNDTEGKILRYKKEGAFYRYSDSVFFYSMMRKFKPKRFIEIGLGHSTALMLDTNEYFLDNKMQWTLIDPVPERLDEIAKPSDEIRNKTQLQRFLGSLNYFN